VRVSAQDRYNNSKNGANLGASAAGRDSASSDNGAMLVTGNGQGNYTVRAAGALCQSVAHGRGKCYQFTYTPRLAGVYDITVSDRGGSVPKILTVTVRICRADGQSLPTAPARADGPRTGQHGGDCCGGPHRGDVHHRRRPD
jgi:hypothetical protein